jgi:hypothetical protein
MYATRGSNFDVCLQRGSRTLKNLILYSRTKALWFTQVTQVKQPGHCRSIMSVAFQQLCPYRAPFTTPTTSSHPSTFPLSCQGKPPFVRSPMLFCSRWPLPPFEPPLLLLYARTWGSRAEFATLLPPSRLL